jgi:hypothetical protein
VTGYRLALFLFSFPKHKAWVKENDVLHHTPKTNLYGQKVVIGVNKF